MLSSELLVVELTNFSMKLIHKFDRYIIAFFFATIILVVATSYFTFNEIIRNHHKHQNKVTIPLYSLITSEIIRPLTISHYMANDQFLIDYIQRSSIEKQKILTYLQQLSTQYNMLAFLAIEHHNFMIDSSNKQTDLNSKAAEWFHRLKDIEKKQFADIGNADNPHLYFDIKIFNNKNEFLGFSGVGIDLDYFAKTFKEFKNRFGIELFIVDEEGYITLTSNNLMRTDGHHRREEKIKINSLSWFKLFETKEKNDNTGSLVSIDGIEILVSELDIPELGWQIYVVSPPLSQQGDYWRSFIEKLFIFFLIGLVLYFMLYNILRYFKRNIVKDSETDHLTQLPNRSFVYWHFEELKEEFESLSVVIADIDNFKNINDNYGHAVGDEVIKAIATQLSQNLRQIDIVGRWGGEEFILLLPDTSAEQTLDVIERIRANVALIPFSTLDGKTTFQTTVSFGVNDGNLADQSLDNILLFADKALYQAKANGRNQTVVYKHKK